MSGDVVIRAEGLGKKYVIGHQAVRERYSTLREVVGSRANALVRTASDMLRGRAIVAGDTTEEIWALKDLDFAVKRGEVVGIIGRNGAGKSTLLKILSRITEPTEGLVEIRGRVASLLEVGTGFHPELTGRENIYLNGAILGMTRAEIRRKFDEIVTFAEVEKFLDTPVKRYSSGMYVRLAFAVAAHLEPEILVVDEVLAVGDAAFQKKCLGKMSEVANVGRTVLFVSHQLGMVAKLCDSAILLADGAIAAKGPARKILDSYRRELEVFSVSARTSAHGLHISQIATMDSSGNPTSDFFFDEEITIRVTISGEIRNPETLLTTTLVSHYGHYISTFVTGLSDLAGSTSKIHHVAVTFPKKIIAPNNYYFRLALSTPPSSVIDVCENVAPIRVRDSGSPMSAFEGYGYGDVILPCRAEILQNEN
jgi:lipopolysaccharide transport system ATP-binding protein